MYVHICRIDRYFIQRYIHIDTYMIHLCTYMHPYRSIYTYMQLSTFQFDRICASRGTYCIYKHTYIYTYIRTYIRHTAHYLLRTNLCMYVHYSTLQHQRKLHNFSVVGRLEQGTGQ